MSYFVYLLVLNVCLSWV